MSAKVRAALRLVGVTVRAELASALRTKQPAELARAIAPEARQLVDLCDRREAAAMLRELAAQLEEQC